MADIGFSPCLKAVADWKLEERGADNARYFFETEDMAGLYNGALCFVIGRKGSGKTALAEHILNIQDHRTFAHTLSFRNFPFGMLAAFEQEGHATASRFTNIWKHIVYMTMLQTFTRNEAISPDLRAGIEEAMPQDLARAASDYIRRITDRSFGLKILSAGGDAASKAEYLSNETPLHERVSILERTIEDHIDGSAYYILFDDLDDDYDVDSAAPDSVYAKLLGGLFLAAIDIRARFAGRANVFPIVFLRDDIYDRLPGNNKAKWLDSILDLRWRNSLLGDLLAHRIYRAADLPAPEAEAGLEEAFGMLFETTRIRAGRRRTRPLLAEIERQSYGRPRDAIAYLRIAAREALRAKEPRIGQDTLKRIERDYSDYLVRDLTDELHTRVPDIEDAFAIISSAGKASQSYNELADRLAAQIGRMSPQAQALGPEGVIDMLVTASVLGKQLPVENKQEYRYQNRFIRVGPADRLYIHRGLHRGLMVS